MYQLNILDCLADTIGVPQEDEEGFFKPMYKNPWGKVAKLADMRCGVERLLCRVYMTRLTCDRARSEEERGGGGMTQPDHVLDDGAGRNASPK